MINNNENNKFVKNKKIKNNIFNVNADLVNEKRKAHSSSISKNNKNSINKINTYNIIINKLNNINETNKKQKTLNNIISTTNKIKPITTKSFQSNKINLGSDNKNPKIKIISYLARQTPGPRRMGI